MITQVGRLALDTTRPWQAMSCVALARFPSIRGGTYILALDRRGGFIIVEIKSDRGSELTCHIGTPIAGTNHRHAGGFNVVHYFVLQRKVNSEFSFDDARFCHSRLAQIL